MLRAIVAVLAVILTSDKTICPDDSCQMVRSQQDHPDYDQNPSETCIPPIQTIENVDRIVAMCPGVMLYEPHDVALTVRPTYAHPSSDLNRLLSIAPWRVLRCPESAELPTDAVLPRLVCLPLPTMMATFGDVLNGSLGCIFFVGFFSLMCVD